MCAANPRSRKATISSFFKSLALRFSFSVCCRTCLRVLFREGLVVLRVASVTLYDAGDADIFSLCGGGMFETNAKGESEFWRVALFRCLEKTKTLLVLPETVFALLLLFLLNVFCLRSTCRRCDMKGSVCSDCSYPDIKLRMARL